MKRKKWIEDIVKKLPVNEDAIPIPEEDIDELLEEEATPKSKDGLTNISGWMHMAAGFSREINTRKD